MIAHGEAETKIMKVDTSDSDGDELPELIEGSESEEFPIAWHHDDSDLNLTNL